MLLIHNTTHGGVHVLGPVQPIFGGNLGPCYASIDCDKSFMPELFEEEARSVPSNLLCEVARGDIPQAFAPEYLITFRKFGPVTRSMQRVSCEAQV